MAAMHAGVPGSSSRASARAALRRRTASVHEALHSATPFAAIAAGRATFENYGQLLLALQRYHHGMTHAVEVGCRRLDLGALQLACEQRRARLADDLATIGRATDLRSYSPVAVQDEAWAIGCLYTLVGSTIGGKVIDRQLDELFPTAAAGRSFFAGSADDGAQWRGFCDRLEAFGAEQESLTALVEGGQFAFEYFATCLKGQS